MSTSPKGNVWQIVVLSAVMSQIGARQELAIDGVKVSRIPTPSEGAGLAASDVARSDFPELNFYIFLPRTSPEIIAAHQYALNCTLSHATLPKSSRVAAGGHLLVVNLHEWIPKEDRRQRTIEVLNENLRDDHFYFREKESIETAPYEYKGKRYTRKWKFFNLFGPHIDPEAASILKKGTGLDTPIIYGPRWLYASLSTLDGGIYYELRGYDQFNQKQWLASLGADEGFSRDNAGDSLAGLFRSGVTGKPRQVVNLFGRVVRPNLGVPLVSITKDLADGVSDPKKHPIYSLMEFEFNGAELIGVLPNGFPTAFLADAQGNRVDVVPDNIAVDHLIPQPNTRRLQPLISCGRCHGDDDFLKPVRNDVRRLLDTRVQGKQLDVLADLKASLDQGGIDDLAGRYAGDFEDIYGVVRNALDRVAFRVAGRGTKDCWAAISSEYGAYYFEPVSPRTACAELGYVLPEEATREQAAKVFTALVPILPGVVSPEDPVVAAMRDPGSPRPAPGLADTAILVVRRDWDRIYSDVAVRAAQSPNKPQWRINYGQMLAPIPLVPLGGLR